MLLFMVTPCIVELLNIQHTVLKHSCKSWITNVFICATVVAGLIFTMLSGCQYYDNDAEYMKTIAAGGFRDITRIASSSPVMWQQICLKNSENISQILGEYIEALSHAKDLVDEGNEPALYALFENSKDYRNSMPNGSAGPIKKQFALYCDIIDETGGIATIATILASNNISIKNIGIIHNREFEEGVLRIEFYDEDSANRASVLLQKYRYVIYEV